jgi:mRNA interferase MazF
MSPRLGEIWLADLGMVAKPRPVVIVSRHDPDPPRALAIYVPLTTQNRGSQYEVELPPLRFLQQVSTANTQGVASLQFVDFKHKLGELPADAFEKVQQALLFALGMA